MTPIAIILLSYKRIDYTLRTINAICDKMAYPHTWYVADDSGEKANIDTILGRLEEREQKVCGWHSEHLGYGGSVNRAWGICSQTTPITLWLENDWELLRELNFAAYVELLERDDTVGMIRLSYLPSGLLTKSWGNKGRMYLEMQFNGEVGAYSGNPHLKHDRFKTFYAGMPTGIDPGNTELKYDSNIQSKKGGPRIIWPISAGTWGHFGHFGAIKSY
jgi:hypothetical protein